MMTITDVNDAMLDLETMITDLLEKFEKVTECSVQSLELEQTHCVANRLKTTVGVKIRVEV